MVHKLSKSEKAGIVFAVIVIVGVVVTLVMLYITNYISPRYVCVNGTCVRNKKGHTDPPGSKSKSACATTCSNYYKCDGAKGCVAATGPGDDTFTEPTCSNACTVRGYYTCDTDNGCVVTTAAEAPFSTSDCNNTCPTFDVVDETGNASTCKPLSPGRFKSKTACAQALLGITTKKCVKNNDSFSCVTSIHGTDDCKCGVTTTVLSGDYFYFPANYVLPSGSGSSTNILRHVLCLMHTYTAISDATLKVALSAELALGSGGGTDYLACSWLIIDGSAYTGPLPTKEYQCTTNSNKVSSIQGGNWYVGETNNAPTNESNNVYSHINSLKSSERTGLWANDPRAPNLIFNWTELDQNSGQSALLWRYKNENKKTVRINADVPVLNKKIYYVCLYFGFSTDDQITVTPNGSAPSGSPTPCGPNHWGTLVETSAFEQ